MTINQLEGKQLKSLEQVFEMINFKVEREELDTSRSIDTKYDSIYRKDNGEVLGLVSRDYQLVTHEQAISSVMNLLEKKKLPKIQPLRIQTTHHGSRMYAEFRLKKKSDLNIHTSDHSVGDLISPGFLITNSYDRSLQFGTSNFIYRLVCSNGMVVRDSIFKDRARHTKNLDLNTMVEKFVESFEAFDEKIVPQVAALTTEIIDSNSLEKELNEIPGWIQEESLDYLEKGGWITTIDGEVEMVKDMTRWDLLNSFTFVMSHSLTTNPKTAFELNKKISERFLAAA